MKETAEGWRESNRGWGTVGHRRGIALGEFKLLSLQVSKKGGDVEGGVLYNVR